MSRPDPPRTADPRDLAAELLQQAGDRAFALLVEQAELISRPPTSGAEPPDPARHLASLGEYRSDDPAWHPLPLEIAAGELRSALDDPAADPTGQLRHTLTIQTLREFATRLLVARQRGELAVDDSYARAISDLAVALSLRADVAPGL